MTGMTLDQLQIFLTVAEQMHFTRAAEVLYMSQSSISSAIQNLEKYYGLKLFDRIGRHIEITEAGKFLQTEARQILEQVNLTERGLRELNNLQRGELKLGASLTIGNYWLPNKISAFKRQYPGIQVYCMLGNTEEICMGTLNRQFDLGFVEGEVHPSETDALQLDEIGGDRLVIVVGESHPWFHVKAIPQAVRQWGINPDDLNVVLEMSSGEMVKAVVESGVGATAISELMVKKELELESLRPVKIEEFKASAQVARVFLQLRHRSRFQTLISQAFAKTLA
jgi:DNA-binding transcriptional LysR family regulator